jgi:hypothetical protein
MASKRMSWRCESEEHVCHTEQSSELKDWFMVLVVDDASKQHPLQPELYEIEAHPLWDPEQDIRTARFSHSVPEKKELWYKFSQVPVGWYSTLAFQQQADGQPHRMLFEKQVQIVALGGAKSPDANEMYGSRLDEMSFGGEKSSDSQHFKKNVTGKPRFGLSLSLKKNNLPIQFLDSPEATSVSPTKIPFVISINSLTGESKLYQVHIRVWSGSTIIYEENHREDSMCRAGEHDWVWSGCNKLGIYNTAQIRNCIVEVTIEGTSRMGEDHNYAAVRIKGVPEKGAAKYFDVSYHEKKKHFHTLAYVDLKDPQRKISADLWMDCIAHFFTGVRTHWHRNDLDVGGKKYEFSMTCSQKRPSHAKAYQVIFRHTITHRSANCSLVSSKLSTIVINVEQKNTTKDGEGTEQLTTFGQYVLRYEAAHEIGHGVLELGFNAYYSLVHKGTSSTIQTNNFSTTDVPEPGNEVDVMRYYKDIMMYVYREVTESPRESKAQLFHRIKGDREDIQYFLGNPMFKIAYHTYKPKSA